MNFTSIVSSRSPHIPEVISMFQNSECAQVLKSLSVTVLQVNVCIEIKSTFEKIRNVGRLGIVDFVPIWFVKQTYKSLQAVNLI